MIKSSTHNSSESVVTQKLCLSELTKPYVTYTGARRRQGRGARQGQPGRPGRRGQGTRCRRGMSRLAGVLIQSAASC